MLNLGSLDIGSLDKLAGVVSDVMGKVVDAEPEIQATVKGVASGVTNLITLIQKNVGALTERFTNKMSPEDTAAVLATGRAHLAETMDKIDAFPRVGQQPE